MLRALASIGLLALLTACATSPSSPALPSGAPSSVLGVSSASGSCCNIFWNKKRLTLRYGSKPTMNAVLTYWAPNGYYLSPLYCRSGSQISVMQGRTWGNPSGYEHVKYSFTTQGAGPDRCALDAILNNTGSPPIAILNFRIK